MRTRKSPTHKKELDTASQAKESCCSQDGSGSGQCCPGLDRRDFVKALGLGTTLAATVSPAHARLGLQGPVNPPFLGNDSEWPTLKSYDSGHVNRIAMPLGGLGTGTVSLGGRGDLRDWEIMNRPAKGFVPARGEVGPSFIIFTEQSEERHCRLIEGPVPLEDYEGSHGSRIPNENIPRFRTCRFDAAYPFGRVALDDTDLPVAVRIKAFNPLVPGDTESSGLPVAILTFEVVNTTALPVRVSICANLPNFIGIDGSEKQRDWKGDEFPVGASRNRNQYREGEGVRGLFLFSEGADALSPAWGTIALTTSHAGPLTYRTNWTPDRWGTAWLEFWDDFSADGRLTEAETQPDDKPMASLAAEMEIASKATSEVTFMLAWHFPNRYTWTPAEEPSGDEDRIGNYYTTRFDDAWDVAAKILPIVPDLRDETAKFVKGVCDSSLPRVVVEAMLFNLSTLRTQTCFRTPDGRFYGWEGIADHRGCCHGSCTHVWNYEQATAFLFGDLARTMREVEFLHATNSDGLMSFRVHLPLSKAQDFGKAAADGQMGCIMKVYRDWQLSGDEQFLRRLWPQVRKAVEFCWIPGGWDADRDGVMEGCQHNTMDVEYYGPNPQMGIWYLGALRAASEMARHVGDRAFAEECRSLFQRGSRWLDAELFNGRYYEHRVVAPGRREDIAPSLLIGMGASDPTRPDYQLAEGCLVDQLVGQFMAHVCGLGYLVEGGNVRTTLRNIKQYNQRRSLENHFNCMRSFALGDEAALLMASYPDKRPDNPFPYFTEVMTGFEYTAAVGMLYEGLVEEGLECIRDIRHRYDGFKRNPFDEAECGHHYARAMASWAALLALSGFEYSGVENTMAFSPNDGSFFWSNGASWGTCRIQMGVPEASVLLRVLHGSLSLSRFRLKGWGEAPFPGLRVIRPEEEVSFQIPHST